jgi:mRNA interferase HicA
VKRLDLECYLRAHGCALVPEGGNRAIWKNPPNGKVAPIPRHREIKEGNVRAVCRQLEITKP